MNLQTIRQEFDQLNHDSLAVHRAKEDRFWGTNMGTDTDDVGFVIAEQAWTAFFGGPTSATRASPRLPAWVASS